MSLIKENGEHWQTFKGKEGMSTRTGWVTSMVVTVTVQYKGNLTLQPWLCHNSTEKMGTKRYQQLGEGPSPWIYVTG